MINSQKKGFVLVCNKNGELDAVIKDDYNIFSSKKNNFYDFFEQDTRYEVEGFLDKINSYKSFYENEIRISEKQKLQNFYFAGAPYNDNAIIIGSIKEDFYYYCNQMRQSLSRDLKFLDELCDFDRKEEINESFIESSNENTDYKSSVHALQQQLDQKEKALKNKILELEQFAHIVSHDLKAPLSQSKLIVHLLDKKLRSQANNKEILELFDMLVISTNHMSDLIDSIQRYSKSGYLDQQLSFFNLTDLFKEIIGNLVIPAKMKISFDQNLPVIYANRQRLNQVLFQLVSNAIRFHHKADGHITMKFQELEEFYSFEIVDDGPGIPEEHHQKIFEIFNRTNLRSNRSGSGVGLSIAKKLVEEGGGILSLDSKVGRGSNFKFIWPKWNGFVPQTAF